MSYKALEAEIEKLHGTINERDVVIQEHLTDITGLKEIITKMELEASDIREKEAQAVAQYAAKSGDEMADLKQARDAAVKDSIEAQRELKSTKAMLEDKTAEL